MIYRFASYCLYSAVISTTPAKAPESKPSVQTSEVPLSTRVEQHIKKHMDAQYRAQPKTKKKRKAKKKVKKTPSSNTILIDRIQKFYDKTEDLTADFIQKYTRVALSRTSESRGVVTIKKPGMMRWDYREPAEKSFIADGNKLVVYEPEEEQAIIDRNFKSSQLTSSMSFLWGKGKLTDSFKLKSSQISGTNTIVYLRPKSDATYKELVLTGETKSGRVLESKLHETAGNTNHFKFRNIRTNTKVKKSRFEFVPPAGIDIIERP